MASYSVYFKESVRKDFEGIPKKESRKILTRISSLGGNPRPQGCEKLTGRDRYRVRQGRYRIVYSVQDEERTVVVVKVGHRKEIYR